MYTWSWMQAVSLISAKFNQTEPFASYLRLCVVLLLHSFHHSPTFSMLVLPTRRFMQQFGCANTYSYQSHAGARNIRFLTP